MQLAEIQTAFAANPELKTALVGALREDVLTAVKGEGFHVRSSDEDAEFISNYEKNTLPGKVAAEIGGKVKEVHDRYDADILEATGLKKGPNEKTYEFNKRVLKELKSQAEKGGGDDILKQKLEAAQGQLKQYEGYIAPDEVNKIKTGYLQKIIKGNMAQAFAKPIAVPAHITDEAQQKQYVGGIKSMIETQFLAKYTPKEDQEGNLVYYEGDKLQVEAKTNKPLTEADLIARDFSAYFAPEKKPGAGAGSGAGTGSGQGDVAETDLKTKADVMKHLTETKKLVSGDKEFNKEYSRIIKEQGITE